MNKTIWAALIIVILAIGAWYVKVHAPLTSSTADEVSSSESGDLGTYEYECDEHVMFTMTPSADMSSIAIVPVSGAAYPAAGTLAKTDAEAGVRYEGRGYVFTGRGESVTLSEGGQSLNCSPVLDQENAPFNFGD